MNTYNLTEEFVQYIWNSLSFDIRKLKTVAGERVQIIDKGRLNRNEGPDFTLSKLQIDDVMWAGSVEIHVKSSDWNTHRHSGDTHYDNVILHVVWTHDQDIISKDGRPIPTLELAKYTSPHLVKNYARLLASEAEILCASQWSLVEDIVKYDMLDRVLVERLEVKSNDIRSRAEGADDEEATYITLMRAFGMKYNSDAFEKLAKLIPLKILRKHADNLLQVEALLYGVSGLLEKAPADNYTDLLRREYHFLTHKYGEKIGSMNASEWKFMRVHPQNFPTIRMAQVASLIAKRQFLFAFFTESTYTELYTVLSEIEVSRYWTMHFVPGKTSEKHKGKLGKSSIQSIIVNVAAPLLAYLSVQKDEYMYMEKALKLLEMAEAEKNHIVNKYSELGFDIKTAFDSQGLLSLHNNYCKHKKCLSCSIGNDLLRTVKDV